MGAPGSGTLRIINPMSAWYRKYKVPPGSTVRFQYPIWDELLVKRQGVILEEAATFTRAMPRLDMLVITPDEVRIVEMKPNAQLRDVGQALQYEQSLKRDVMLRERLDRPMRVVMVTLQENLNVRALCEGQGIEYVVIPRTEIEVPA